MGPEFWTSLSGLLVSASGIYYAALVFLRKAPSNPVTWGAWSVIGAALFVTSGATFGMNPMTFGVINPAVITFIAIWRQYRLAEKPSKQEIIGSAIGIMAIIAWLFAKRYQISAEWTLLFAMAADCVPALPILQNALEKPLTDRPFPWILYAFGYGILGFGLEELSMFTLALPIYMFVAANGIALPLVLYRIRHRMPIREWL